MKRSDPAPPCVLRRTALKPAEWSGLSWLGCLFANQRIRSASATAFFLLQNRRRCNRSQVRGRSVCSFLFGLGPERRATDHRHVVANADVRQGQCSSSASSIMASGSERHCSYDGLLMTSVEDERHDLLVRNIYRGRVLARREFPNGQSISYGYNGLSGRYYADKTEVETASSVPNTIKNPPK